MTCYSKQVNMLKDINICHSREIYPTYMGKIYWIMLQKTGLDRAKSTSKKQSIK